MKEYEKTIKIDEKRILKYDIRPGYAKSTYTVSEGFLENGDLIKTYSLSQWDDYSFNGWLTNDEEKTTLSFEFDINHPLFMPLFHLLDYDDELIIDDDDTKEDNVNYLRIYRKEGKIYMDFINELDDHNTFDKFHVFIKNILIDGRSKIDANFKDTKERLILFFNEMDEVLSRESHQISLEEYLLSNPSTTEKNNVKRFFKRRK